jgi:hypothetical protein
MVIENYYETDVFIAPWWCFQIKQIGLDPTDLVLHNINLPNWSTDVFNDWRDDFHEMLAHPFSVSSPEHRWGKKIQGVSQN